MTDYERGYRQAIEDAEKASLDYMNGWMPSIPLPEHVVGELQEKLGSLTPQPEQHEPSEWGKLHNPRPLSEWHEDYSSALWHRMPIEEPPYVGSPDCSDWPYSDEDEPNLFWTPLPSCNLINDNWEAAQKEQAK